MNTRKLKFNIKRTTPILIAVVLLLSVTVGAVGVPTIWDAVLLSEYPYKIVNNNDGTKTVVSTIEDGPIWRYEVVKPSDGVWYTVDGNPLTISSDDYSGQFAMTGYIWPNGRIIDISELDRNAVFNVNYDCTFELELPSEPLHSGEVYVSLVPRFRLLRESGGQIAFVLGDSVWNSLVNTDDYGSTLYVDAVASQTIDLNAYNPLPDIPVAFVEIKWQFNIRIENVEPEFGMYFSMKKGNMSFQYDIEDVDTDSELADKFNEDIGDVNNRLDGAGDAFNSVYQPDANELGLAMKPVSQLIDRHTMSTFSEITGFISGTTLITTYLTITVSVVMVSYVLFGKKA